MKDLLVIIPSRGRPDRLREMLTAARDLSAADTSFVIACDDDDVAGYLGLRGECHADQRIRWHAGPRDTLSGWTNKLASRYASRYRALASLGDDHIPRTGGWDKALLDAIAAMGGTGFAYPDDKRRSDIPEAVVISADIVRALGWMCLPETSHFYCDDAWADLGKGADCIRYCPEVVIEHVHYLTRPDLAGRDTTYADAEQGLAADGQAYQRWRSSRMASDIARIRALREKPGREASGTVTADRTGPSAEDH
jgi:hypothetical protein